MKGNIDKFLSEQLIVLLTERLTNWNIDEWMKKLSKILWDISNDKWIEHEFEIENNIARIPTRWEI